MAIIDKITLRPELGKRVTKTKALVAYFACAGAYHYGNKFLAEDLFWRDECPHMANGWYCGGHINANTYIVGCGNCPCSDERNSLFDWLKKS